MPTIAVLLSDDVRLPKVDGLKDGLHALGLGQVKVEVFSAGGDRATLETTAARLVASRPAVAVAGGGVEAVALKAAAAPSQPMVLMGVASTVRTGLVASLVRPGGNITGVDNQHAELSAKRLELLVKLLPHVRRVLLLYDPTVIPGRHALEVTEAAAAQLGVSLGTLSASSHAEALEGIARIQPGQYDAALLLPAFVLESAWPQLAVPFGRLNLPVMGPLELEGQGGLLAAYGTSMRDQGRQSARFAAKVLRGQAPGAIPVETPDTPELVVDLRVAEGLGLTLSPTGLAFARTIGAEGGVLP